MTSEEILAAAKEAGLYMTSPERIAAVERLVAIIERRTIERCAVVWIHSGHLHQAMNQPFLCRVLPEQCEGYKPLIVKPGE